VIAKIRELKQIDKKCGSCDSRWGMTTFQRGISMATFITTIKFTDQGEKNIQETTKRAAAFKATAKKIGAKVIAQYWTLGQFDGVLIYEAPDDETATAVMLHLGSLDNVHTMTMRAFVASEMEAVMAKLPTS
jgi:uncharacterized protein with GYD domain